MILLITNNNIDNDSESCYIICKRVLVYIYKE